MTDLLFGLVASHGIAIILGITFLSCLAVPVPSSFVMLAGGAFVSSGDLTGWQVVAAAFGGAVLGDQLGYEVGRRGGAPLLARLERSPRRAQVLNRSRGLIDRWGGSAVFLSRWAMSPLGPYVNPLAGALGMGRLRFVASDWAGEAVWVTIYVGLGYFFASNIVWLAELAGNLMGFVTAGGVTVLLGLFLWRRRA
jgi:membrane protein DedA with SNARE-associated domain